MSINHTAAAKLRMVSTEAVMQLRDAQPLGSELREALTFELMLRRLKMNSRDWEASRTDDKAPKFDLFISYRVRVLDKSRPYGVFRTTDPEVAAHYATGGRGRVWFMSDIKVWAQRNIIAENARGEYRTGPMDYVEVTES